MANQEQNLDPLARSASDSSNGFTPLHVAALQGLTGTIQELVKAGADLEAASAKHEAEDWCGFKSGTALFVAARAGHLEAVRKLIKAGANLEAAETKFGRTSLYIASRVGHIEVVRELIQAGADVNANTDDRNTALHIASPYGHLHVVRILLEAGASYKRLSAVGLTAFETTGVDEVQECIKQHIHEKEGVFR